MGNFSCMQHISAEFGVEIGFQLCESIFVAHVHKGQRGITMATSLGTKIAISV